MICILASQSISHVFMSENWNSLLCVSPSQTASRFSTLIHITPLEPSQLNVQLLWIYKTYSINILCEGNYESWELGTGRYVENYPFWIIFCSKFTYTLYKWYYIYMCGVAIWGTEQWSGLYEVIQLLIIKRIYLFILILKYNYTQGIVIDIKL